MGKITFGWLRTCIEIPTVLIFLSFTLSQTVIYNFIMYRSCYVDMHYNKTDCERLGTGDDDDLLAEIEEVVQPYASVILMVQEILNQVAPAILCALLGSWSDTHGRRPILNSSMFGFSLGGLLALIVMFVDSISAWWFSAVSLAIALFGGVITFITAVVCYLSDISSDKTRGMRMGIFEGLMTAGMLLGTVATSYIFNSGGYITVMAIVVSGFILGFLYHLFFMVESVKFSEKSKDEKKVGLFSITNMKEMMVVTFKPRENYGRTVLILALILSIFIKFIGHSDTSIYYLFLRLKLNWDMEHYTLFKTFQQLLTILMAIVGTFVFHNALKIREIPLVLITGLIGMAGMIFQAAAEEDWHIYVGGILRAISGIQSPMVRSLLSKLVNPSETGKVFALSSAAESLILLVGVLGYTGLYNMTLGSNPGAFNYITAGIFGAITVFAGWVLVMQKFYQKEDVFFIKKKEESEPLDVEKADIN